MKKIDWSLEAVRSQEIVFSICMGTVALLSQGNPMLEFPEILWAFAGLLIFNLAYHLVLRRYGDFWGVPLISMAVNTLLVSAVLWKSGGSTSNFWPMYLLPIFTACMYLGLRQVLLALLSAAGFLFYFYLEAVWRQQPWEIMELSVKVGVLGLSAAVTGFFAAQERSARQGMELNRAELDRLAGTLAGQTRTAEAGDMETLGRLLDGVLHNVNNGLMVILGSSEILLDESDPHSARRRDLERIQQTARNMGQLTANLMKWAHPEQPVEDVDLSEILAQAGALLDYKLKRKRIGLKRSFPEGLPKLRLRAAHVQQAFVALLFQAADRADPGSSLELSADCGPAALSVRIRYPSSEAGDPLDGLETAASLLAVHGARLQGGAKGGASELLVEFILPKEAPAIQ